MVNPLQEDNKPDPTSSDSDYDGDSEVFDNNVPYQGFTPLSSFPLSGILRSGKYFCNLYMNECVVYVIVLVQTLDTYDIFYLWSLISKISQIH